MESHPQALLPPCHFLGWDQSLVTLATEWLLERQYDLANTIVLVPTSQSGRLLREGLAKTGCALAPKVTLPQFLFQEQSAGEKSAERLAWTESLMQVDITTLPHLFPPQSSQGLEQSFSWAFNIANQFCDLYHTLVEHGQFFSNAHYHAPDSEKDRWANLIILEKIVKQKLAQWGINHSIRPTNISPNKRIVLAGICDINLRVNSQLDSLLNSGVPIDVLIHAPSSQAQHFGNWGAPRAEHWCSTPIDINGWQESITIAENPATLASTIVNDVAKKHSSPEALTLGVCDSDLNLSIQRAFTQAGWSNHNPEGTSLSTSTLYQFLFFLKSWLHPLRPAKPLLGLIRLPEICAFFEESHSSQQLIKQLDLAMAERIPETANELLNYTGGPSRSKYYQPLHDFITKLLEATTNLEKGNQIRALRGWIARAINKTSEDVASACWESIASTLDTLEQISPSHSLQSIIDIILHGLRQNRTYQNVSDSVFSLKGWLEISYDQSPNLILAGLHEGKVSTVQHDDPFLPEGFRETLGIETIQQRYARDSFLFQSYLKSHTNTQIYLSKVNAQGDPQSPSRLLLRAQGKELAQRVQKLFGNASHTPKNPSAWQRDWTLDIPVVANPFTFDPPKPLSPSALKDYLSCPTRFYLKRILKMQRPTVRKLEMDARDFGNLIHGALEDFGRDTSMRDLTDEDEISHAVVELLEKRFTRLYGTQPTVPLQIQYEIARSRLQAFATCQSAERAAGWRIIDVELPVGKTPATAFSVNGHPITMYLDRVDYNEAENAYRVLDYKTSSTAKPPGKEHLTLWKDAEHRPQLSELINKKNKDYRWKQLQLPLYAHFARQHYKTSDIPSIGYFNLPSSASNSEVSVWKEFDEELLDSAIEWASRAIDAIQRDQFFEPAILPTAEAGYDDFAILAQGSLRDALAL